ncbi:hypothetical protein D3C71_1415810 [compost metagenome]
MGAQAPAADPDGGHWHAGADGVPVHGGAQGLLPGAGHRRHPGHFRSAAIDFLRRHERAPAGTGQGHPGRPGGREPVLLHWRGWRQLDPQQRPVADQPQVAQRPRPERHASDCPPATGTGQTGRHPPVHAAGAGPDHRRPGQPHAVSVQHVVAGLGAAEPVERASGRGFGRPAGIDRRRQRFAGQGLAGLSGD